MNIIHYSHCADYTVLVNTTFNDPNATASDGSPGYSVSDYSKSKTGILNTSMINSTATYTYTAYDDAAGNPGASITRTVTVVDYIHLAVTSLTVSSNNPENTSYAKAGDEITITLVTDGSDIESATGSILGDNILTQNSPTGTITFSKTITQSDTNGNLTFGISVANSTGYAASVSQNDLTSSNIIIDTVPPLLYLYGANNTVSYVGSSYVDAGAISYDLSHGILDVTGTSTVNTGTAGTYDVTYDAPDSAGNPANIIRIVHVQEIPQLSLSSESSDLLITPESPIADPVQYPHLTDPFHIETVQIDGSTYALVASNHDGGFTILNMDNPESPCLVSVLETSTQAILFCNCRSSSWVLVCVTDTRLGDSGLSMFRIVNPPSWFDATSAYVEPSICTVSIWNGSVRCGYCTGSAIGDSGVIRRSDDSLDSESCGISWTWTMRIIFAGLPAESGASYVTS